MSHCQQLHSLPHAQLSSPQTRQHAQGCAECAAMLQAIEEARRTITPQRLPPSRALAIRKALRDSLEAPLLPEVHSSLRFLWGVAALVTAGLVAWWFIPTQTPVAPLAPSTPIAWIQLAPQSGALFSQESTPTEELILLQRGTLELQVDARKPSQRVKVRSQRGEELVVVQAHVFITAGYAFEEVTVKSGAVEFISAQGAKQLLSVEHPWEAPSVPQEPASTLPQTSTTADTPPTTLASVAPKTTRSSAPQKVSPPSSETAFQRGVDALRDGEYQEAAALFAEAETSPALAQESAYFRTKALHKAGALAEEKAALQDFLRKYPGSTHAAEVHHTLAWMLLKDNDREGAVLHFNAVLTSGSASLQESAQKGLDQLNAASAPHE